MTRHRCLETGGHKSLDQGGTTPVRLGDNSLLEEGPDPVPGHQRANLVATQQLHFALRITNCHSHAIAIRISADDRIRTRFFCQVNRPPKS